MAAKGFMNKDHVLSDLVRKSPLRAFTSANVGHIARRHLADFGQKSMALQFTLARQRLLEHTPDLADQIVSVEEYFSRVGQAYDSGQPSISIFWNGHSGEDPGHSAVAS